MHDDFSWKTFNKQSLAHQALKGFLLLDVQYSPERAKNLLQVIADVQEGKLSCWSDGGNAYFFEFRLDGAQLEIALDDVDDTQIPVVPLNDFLEALLAWKAYCESR